MARRRPKVGQRVELVAHHSTRYTGTVARWPNRGTIRLEAPFNTVHVDAVLKWWPVSVEAENDEYPQVEHACFYGCQHPEHVEKSGATK